MTGIFSPVNDDHAIERVVFGISFDRAFEAEEIAAIRQQHHLWLEDLPAVREPPSFVILADAEQKLQAIPAPTIEFAFVRPDGSAVWSLRFIGPEAMVECTRYTRWDKIWSAAFKHLERVLALTEVAGGARVVRKATLVVQDAFVTDEGVGDVSEVVSPTPMLPSQIFNVGPEWHVHTGHFEPCNDGSRVLSNLNVDAVLQRFEKEDGPERHRISMLHVLIADRSESEPDEQDAIIHWLKQKMDEFHASNKKMLGHILSDKIIARIGLQSGV